MVVGKAFHSTAQCTETGGPTTPSGCCGLPTSAPGCGTAPLPRLDAGDALVAEQRWDAAVLALHALGHRRRATYDALADTACRTAAGHLPVAGTPPQAGGFLAFAVGTRHCLDSTHRLLSRTFKPQREA